MRRLFRAFKKLLVFLFKRYYRNMMLGDMKDMIAHNPAINTEKTVAEDDHIKKWSVLSNKTSPIAYRMYSPFIGANVDIVPPDVLRPCIEPILNPGENVAFYNDKNSLNLFVSEENTPKVYLRSIGDKLMDGSYNPVQKENIDSLFTAVDRVIVKPAKGLGGAGITFFCKNSAGQLINDENELLTFEWLINKYGKDYLIQECFVQSDYIAQFNPTSVNTIRAITYRDVNTGEIHFMGAVLRMGAKGAFIDNATAGGGFVGIDSNGVLKDKVFDKYARYSSVFNDIDFSKTHFQIPNFEVVKEFAKKISLRVPHMSLFALDIVLDNNNVPKLIEVNTSSFTDYFLQLTEGPVFGNYTDDVISYCSDQKDNLSVSFKYVLLSDIKR